MTGLTGFIIDMLKNELPSRDPRALAAKYQISPAHAAGYLRMRGW